MGDYNLLVDENLKLKERSMKLELMKNTMKDKLNLATSRLNVYMD